MAYTYTKKLITIEVATEDGALTLTDTSESSIATSAIAAWKRGEWVDVPTDDGVVSVPPWAVQGIVITDTETETVTIEDATCS